MAFILKKQGRYWVGDISWRSHTPKPSVHAMRVEGRKLGFSWFARCDQFPEGVGYLTVTLNDAKEELNSLAVAMAALLGPETYAEFDLGGGQLWLIATNDAGYLLPGSDKVYSLDGLEIARENLSGFVFKTTLKVEELDLENYINQLKPTRIKLQPISRKFLYKRLAMMACVIVAGYIGNAIYDRHLEKLKNEEAKQRLQNNLRPVVAPSGPSEWVNGCLGAVPGTVFKNGWALTSWSCEGSSLSVTWETHGGHLVDGPSGVLANNGRTIIQSIPFAPVPGYRTSAIEGDPIRLLLTFLGQIGVSATVGTSRFQPTGHHSKNMLSVVTVQFEMPTTPSAVEWDRYARLNIRKMTRILLTKDMQPKIGGFIMNAAFVAPNHEGH